MKTTALVAVLVLALAAVASARVLHTRHQPPQGWAIRQAADPETPISFIVALKQQNLDVLETRFWAVSDPTSPQYRQFMTREQIADLVRPTVDTRARVLSWLSQYVSLEQIEDMGDNFKVSTVASVAELMLSTRFVNFQHHRTQRTIVRQLGQYSVPSNVDQDIDLIAGITEFPDMERIRKVQPEGGFVGIVPQTLAALYNAEGVQASQGTNSSAGVIEWEQQYFSPSDLASYGTQTATQIPVISQDHIIGQNEGSQPGDEAQLDVELIAAVAGANVDQWFWINSVDSNGATAWLYGWITTFNQAADVPLVVSMSYGWSEAQQCQDGIGGAECQQLGIDSVQYVHRVNTEFQKAGLRGVSLFASSGDSGANGRTDGFCSDSILHPTFPAASPYVTAVGATQAVNPQTSLQNPPPICQSQVTCVSQATETAVSYDQANFASGGGFSNVAPMPQYQAKAVAAYKASGVQLPPSSYFNQTGRGYPDVGALGSAIAIVYEGQVTGVGGTSASSPIFAGYAALLNDIALQKDGKPLGFLNPLLYKMAEDQPSTFNDVTVGDNICTEDGCSSSCKGYKCAAGWDPVTGLGTPNFKNMASYLKSQL